MVQVHLAMQRKFQTLTDEDISFYHSLCGDSPIYVEGDAMDTVEDLQGTYINLIHNC